MRRAAILSFSRQGGETARRIAFLLKREYDCRLFAPEKHAGAGIAPIAGSLCTLAGGLMKETDALVFVGACGIAVRAIAPHIRSKTEDPAVVCVDERVPLWLPGFFLHNVFPDAVEHVAGVWGRTGLTSGGKVALDDKAAVAVGLSRGNSCSVGGSVFLWLLQHNAHIHRPGNHHYGFL